MKKFALTKPHQHQQPQRTAIVIGDGTRQCHAWEAAGWQPTGANSYAAKLGPVIEVDLTQRLRGRDSRV
jgi:hypothetical protein